MFPPNSWCFDLEIVNAILSKGETPEPGIRYCKGWTDHAGMGISVLVIARPDNSEVQAFIGDGSHADFPDCRPLSDFLQVVADADLLIGHNSRSFDAAVLEARGIIIPRRKHLDFFHEVKRVLRNNFPRGYRLDALSDRCGGPRKTEDGAFAPHMWQRGEKERVVEYCKNDIAMTAAVASFYAANGGKIPSANESSLLQLRLPIEIQTE